MGLSLFCSPALCHVPPFSPPARRRKPLLFGGGPGKGRAVYGRLRLNMALGFRRRGRAAPIWPENGPQQPERRHTAVGADVGPGKAETAALGGHTAELQEVSSGQDGTPALVGLGGGHGGADFLDRFADFGAVVRLGRVDEQPQSVEQGA